MNDFALQVSRVCKDYPLYVNDRQRVLDRMGVYSSLPKALRPSIKLHHALVDVSFNIAHGERVGIVGRNGAGKTTLLRLIAGAMDPTAGTIEAAGKIHSLLQTTTGFDQEFTGRENIRSALEWAGVSEKDRAAIEADVIEFCELDEYLDQPYKAYSAGMAARLQFAVATAIRPDILIVDEVLGAGDTYFMQKSAKRMAGLALSGCTLLLVSHASQQVLQFCERAIWIERGHVVMDGPALEIVNAYNVFLDRKTFGAVGTETRTEGVSQIKLKEALTDILADGKRVYRFTSKPGVKINSVSAFGAAGQPKALFTASESLHVEFELMAETSGWFECRYLLTFWTPDAVRAARAENHNDKFYLQAGETRRVRATIDPLLLNHGDYLVTISIYDTSLDGTANHIEARYDALMHVLDIKILPSADPYLVGHPGIWSASS